MSSTKFEDKEHIQEQNDIITYENPNDLLDSSGAEYDRIFREQYDRHFTKNGENRLTIDINSNKQKNMSNKNGKTKIKNNSVIR